MVRKSGTVEYKCSSDGSTKWFSISGIYAQMVPPSNVDYNILKIKNISKSDEGKYICYGLNLTLAKNFVSYFYIGVIGQ